MKRTLIAIMLAFVAACGDGPTAPSPRVPFVRSGVGDAVFTIPVDVSTVRVTGRFEHESLTMNFVIFVEGRLVLNELLGGAHQPHRYEGTILITSGGLTQIRYSNGVAWSIEEVR